jgi:hypothetical protein
VGGLYTGNGVEKSAEVIVFVEVTTKKDRTLISLQMRLGVEQHYG